MTSFVFYILKLTFISFFASLTVFVLESNVFVSYTLNVFKADALNFFVVPLDRNDYTAAIVNIATTITLFRFFPIFSSLLFLFFKSGLTVTETYYTQFLWAFICLAQFLSFAI